MFEQLVRVFKIKDIRNSILFVLSMLLVFRVAAHIPIPGVNFDALQQFFESNQVFGLISLFSGGSLERFSIVALGVAPYITASIIFQLLTMISPRLEEMQKDPGGPQKINQWTRYATVPLAALQSFGIINLLQQQASFDIFGGSLTSIELTGIIVTMTTGTIFLMWIGELISERNIGNGISLLIFAGIIAGLPTLVQQTVITFDPSQIFELVIFALVALATVVGVVVINEGARNIPVTYARHVRGGGSAGGVSTHLPLKVNMAGVIPIIFAISLILFPPLIAQFFLQAQSPALVSAAEWVIAVFNNQLIYGILYFLFVFGFTYFYTAIVFKPDQIAENLQRQGGFIPGIRPGKQTEDYLTFVTTRIILAGAFFLGLIAVLPLIVQQFTGSQSLVVGGASVLIVVSVVIEIVKQIESQLTMRDYDGV